MVRVTTEEAVRRACVGGPEGITVKELARVHPQAHHGQVSGALSRAHSQGRLIRLTTKREGASVYTLPEFRNGRTTIPTVEKHKAQPEQECQVRKTAEAWLARDPQGWSAAGRNPKGFVVAMREALEGR